LRTFRSSACFPPPCWRWMTIAHSHPPRLECTLPFPRCRGLL
jgi:hypothetical protein